MDKLAGRLYEPVMAQTAINCRCRNLIVEPEMDADRYQTVLKKARLVVSHAGIGTVLAAQDAGIPVVLVPRRAEFGEHRNDHQIGTVRSLVGRQGITAVWNTDGLGSALGRATMFRRRSQARGLIASCPPCAGLSADSGNPLIARKMARACGRWFFKMHCAALASPNA